MSAAKAEVISRAVAVLGRGAAADTLAAAVQAAVLPDAATQTVNELRRAVTRAVIAVDPAGAADRADTARTARGVTLFPLPDGMAGLWADLSAADAHTVMLGLDSDADRTAARHRAAGQPVPGQSARRADALLGWAHRALTDTDPPTVHGRRPRVQVTASMTTLLGLDDQPAELDGYGPIDAHTARRIAADATWTRLLTDPATGALLDYGRTTYHPPADLRDYILTRDPECTFPGCPRPARRCHLDHLHEWQHGGRTCKHNLHPLCHRHHTCKTTGDWTITRTEDGTLTWTSPTGRTYTRPPHRHTPRPPPRSSGSNRSHAERGTGPPPQPAAADPDSPDGPDPDGTAPPTSATRDPADDSRSERIKVVRIVPVA